MAKEYLFEINNLSKAYPGVIALKNINLKIRRNTVHCVVGENGAGKSTFIKILTGAILRSDGVIYYHDRKYNPKNTRDALKLGISTIFQELNVVKELTVEQNLTLGMEDSRFGIIRRIRKSNKIFKILKSLDPNIAINQKTSELSVAQQQTIEIVKALATDSRLIIMDEPTSSLSEEESRNLFKIIKKLKEEGVTVIYISHKLNEIFEIGDYVTVLRDGEMVGTEKISEIKSKEKLIKMMIGKIVTEKYIPSKINYDNKILTAEKINNRRLKNINFELFEGEILGFYGLIGSGKTEIVKVLYGVDDYKGSIKIKEKKTRSRSPKEMIKEGISMVPEERRSEGLFSSLSIRENIPIMNIKKFTKNGITNIRKERNISKEYIDKMRIVAKNEDQAVAYLSGGNQQKVVVSKCLNADTPVILLDEPTRGVDVGAKEEIHNIIRELSKIGVSITVFSSDLNEVTNLCDRIVLLYEGQIKDIVKNGYGIDKERIMHVVTGGGK